MSLMYLHESTLSPNISLTSHLHNSFISLMGHLCTAKVVELVENVPSYRMQSSVKIQLVDQTQQWVLQRPVFVNMRRY